MEYLVWPDILVIGIGGLLSLIWWRVGPRTKKHWSSYAAESSPLDFHLIIPTQEPTSPLLRNLVEAAQLAGVPYTVLTAKTSAPLPPDIHFFEVATSPDKPHKKELLLAFWEHYKSDWILQLDDDVILPPGYFKTLASQHRAFLNILPIYTRNPQWFGFLDEVEHLGIVLTGLGMRRPLFPSSCSGGHLLYHRKLAEIALEQQATFLRNPSGDDQDLLAFAAQNNLSIQSLSHPQLWIQTAGKKRFFDFVGQRTRWIKKPASFQFLGAWFLGIFNFAFYLLVLPLTAYLLGFWVLIPITLKALVDRAIFSRSAPAELCPSWAKIFIFQCIYPVYLGILMMGIILRKQGKW